MHNPFSPNPELWDEAEPEAAEFFGELSGCQLEAHAAGAIRGRLLAALSSAAANANGARGHFGVLSAAVLGPLLAVGAVSAAAGNSPVPGPASLIESAATSMGIGGNSAGDSQELDKSEDAENPGSAGPPENTRAARCFRDTDSHAHRGRDAGRRPGSRARSQPDGGVRCPRRRQWLR